MTCAVRIGFKLKTEGSGVKVGFKLRTEGSDVIRKSIELC